jgi:hypothetical protein
MIIGNRTHTIAVFLSTLFLCFALVFSLSSHCLFAQSGESIFITTYYPSPSGSYMELRAQRMAIGDNYINGNSFSWNGGSINANADLVVEGSVGIGQTNPQAKLEVRDNSPSGGLVPLASFGHSNWNNGYLRILSDTSTSGTPDAIDIIVRKDAGGRSYLNHSFGNWGGEFNWQFQTPSGTPQTVMSLSGDYGQPVLWLYGYAHGGQVQMQMWSSTPRMGIRAYNDGTNDRFLLYTDVANSLYPVDIYNNNSQSLLTLRNNNVGIGTDNPGSKLHVFGNITATGTKNFEIDHPSKKNTKLVHSAVEGPEAAVYYRGEGQLENGQAIVVLPDYFEPLTRREGRTVQLTPKGREPFQLSATDVAEGKFQVFGSKPSSLFYWEVKAIRADIEPLKVEVEKKN